MNIKKGFNFIISASLAVSILATSCAKDQKIDVDDIEKEIINAHIKVVHKDTLKPLSTGVYVLTEKKGTGKEIKKENSVYVRYSTLSLNGNYVTTSREEIAKQVGGFAYSNYYGPVLFEMNNYTLIKGVEEALMGKREGSIIQVIVPTWASEYDYPKSNRVHSSPIIYHIEVVKVIEDFPQYELDTLQRYSNLYFDGLDSLKKGYYFTKLITTESDSVKAGSSIRYNYVGRLLNGFVFDTNIEDTARKYRIYNSERSYSPIQFEVHEVGQPSSSGESVVNGFAQTLLNMRYGERAITFFGSDWGYGSANQSFGKKQQLQFFIEVLPKE